MRWTRGLSRLFERRILIGRLGSTNCTICWIFLTDNQRYWVLLSWNLNKSKNNIKFRPQFYGARRWVGVTSILRLYLNFLSYFTGLINTHFFLYAMVKLVFYYYSMCCLRTFSYLGTFRPCLIFNNCFFCTPIEKDKKARLRRPGSCSELLLYFIKLKVYS